MKKLTTIIGAVGLAVLALPAAALTYTGTPCLVGSVSGAVDCEGIFDGNDSNQDLDGLFGLNDWDEVLKLDAGSGVETGNGVTLTVGGGGTWSVDTYGGFFPVMFVLKGGPTFSAFLMDLNVLSGTWDTQSMLKGNGQRGAGLSHWTIYATPDDGGPTPGPDPVPLPAAAWLMLSGAGALGALRLRRKG